jgi:hypothetical protein
MLRRHRHLLVGLALALVLLLTGLWVLGRKVGRSFGQGAQATGALMAAGFRQLERIDTLNTSVPPGSRIQLDSLVVGQLWAAVRIVDDTGQLQDTGWVSPRRIGPLAALFNPQGSVVYLGTLTAPELKLQLQNSDAWAGHLDSIEGGALIIRLKRGTPAVGQRAPAQLYLPQDTLSLLVF